jgi:formylglycine-generating enzyme required for sulfatase activity
MKACPEMIVVPAGTFSMGTPADEANRKDSEDPRHTVTIAHAFAVSRYALTFEDWDACGAFGDCDPQLDDSGYGRGAQPVINVTWDDAQRYVAWLSRMTGKPYRLLSEAEYEYATRAGTTTAYWWGNDIGKGNADCDGCGSRWDDKQPAPAGSFAANGFGLYELGGSVWEWVADCWNKDYNGAPADGSAWMPGDCKRHVVRAGSWGDNPPSVRSGNRYNLTGGNRNNYTGFRVARTLAQ